MRKQEVSAIALTVNNVKDDCIICKNVENRLYSMILASPKMVLELQSWFWSSTIRAISSTFCQRLAYIAVDKAHLIWDWREFRKEYNNIGRLRTVLLSMLIMALSVILTNNNVEYVRKSLDLRSSVQLCKRPLDSPNIILNCRF